VTCFAVPMITSAMLSSIRHPDWLTFSHLAPSTRPRSAAPDLAEARGTVEPRPAIALSIHCASA